MIKNLSSITDLFLFCPNDVCLACFITSTPLSVSLCFLLLCWSHTLSALSSSYSTLPSCLLLAVSPCLLYYLPSLHFFPTVCLASSCFPILYFQLFPTVCLVYSLFYCLPCLSPPSSPYPTSSFLPALSSLSPYLIKSSFYFLYVTHFISANLLMSFHAHIFKHCSTTIEATWRRCAKVK